METEKTEGEVDTTNNEGEGESVVEENIVRLSKEEYDTLIQTSGSLKKELKDLKKSLKETTKETPQQTTSDELNSGDKALMVAYGIKGKDEIALAQAFMKRTGDDVDSLIEDDIFQGKLAKLREAKASAQATPSGTKRSVTSTKDSVEHNVEQVESGQVKLEDLPFEMRVQVADAMVEKQRQSKGFRFK